MKRRPKSPGLEEKSSVPASESDAILQVKVWLTGISPMVWRRVLVPANFTLRELHGVIQVAMGWEGIHLYEFHLRAARYGSWELSASSPDITLAALRLRKGARFIYEYDLNIPWRHEVRIEDRLEPDARKTYPVCTAGDGACPPEDCGGPASFMDHGHDGYSFDALEDLDTMVEVLQQVALKDGSEPLALDQETSWRLEDALERGKAREEAQGRPFSRRQVNAVFALASISTSCTSSGDTLCPPLCEQVGGEQRCFVSSPLPDAGNQRVGGRISQLVEPALQGGGCRFGIETGGGDALVAEEALQIGDALNDLAAEYEKRADDAGAP